MSVWKSFWGSDTYHPNLTFGGRKTAIEATVKVLLYDGGDDIINQYIAFCRKTDECRRKYPEDARKAINEAIDFCIASGILADYLKKRKPEVIHIMIALFSEEHAREMERINIRKEALEEGRKEGRKEVFKIRRLLSEHPEWDDQRLSEETGFPLEEIPDIRDILAI